MTLNGRNVRPSVTFRYRDHIISRPNSLRLLLGMTPIWAIWCNRNITPKIGWNRGGVTQEHKKHALSPKRCKIGPRLLRRTNRKSHTRFRLVPNDLIWPWTAETFRPSVTGTPPKLGWYMVGSWAQKPVISLKRCKIIIHYCNTQSIVGFSVIPKCVTLNDL